MASYQKAGELDPSYPTPFNDMGVLLEEQGKLSEAEKSYQKALALNPSYPEAHGNIAMLYERLGDKEKATYHWLKRYQLGDPQQPGTQRAKERLAALGASGLIDNPTAAQELIAKFEKKPEEPDKMKVAEAAAEAEAAKKAQSKTPTGQPKEEKPNDGLTGFLSINEGIEVTNLPTVRLKTVTQGIPNVNPALVASVQYSNDGVNFMPVEPFTQTKLWILPPGDGIKTVYARLLDKNKKPLAQLKDTVTLDTSPLTIYVSSSQGDKREAIVRDLLQTHDQSQREFRSVTGEQGGMPSQ